MFPSMNLISRQKQVWQASRGQQRALTEQYDVTFTHLKLAGRGHGKMEDH